MKKNPVNISYANILRWIFINIPKYNNKTSKELSHMAHDYFSQNNINVSYFHVNHLVSKGLAIWNHIQAKKNLNKFEKKELWRTEILEPVIETYDLPIRKNPTNDNLIKQLKVRKYYLGADHTYFDYPEARIMKYLVFLNHKNIGEFDFDLITRVMYKSKVKKGFRQQGVGTFIYDYIEKDLGITVLPDIGFQSEDALAFWKKRLKKNPVNLTEGNIRKFLYLNVGNTYLSDSHLHQRQLLTNLSKYFQIDAINVLDIRRLGFKIIDKIVNKWKEIFIDSNKPLFIKKREWREYMDQINIIELFYELDNFCSPFYDPLKN